MAVGIIAEELHSFWLNFNCQYVMYEFSKREFDLKRIKWGDNNFRMVLSFEIMFGLESLDIHHMPPRMSHEF